MHFYLNFVRALSSDHSRVILLSDGTVYCRLRNLLFSGCNIFGVINRLFLSH